MYMSVSMYAVYVCVYSIEASCFCLPPLPYIYKAILKLIFLEGLASKGFFGLEGFTSCFKRWWPRRSRRGLQLKYYSSFDLTELCHTLPISH